MAKLTKPLIHCCVHAPMLTPPVTLPGNIRARLCRECMDEMNERLGEKVMPPTPIEVYAQEMESAMLGCTRLLKAANKKVKGSKDRLCGMACDEGKAFCPRCEFLAPIEEAQRRDREDKRLALRVDRSKKAKSRHHFTASTGLQQ